MYRMTTKEEKIKGLKRMEIRKRSEYKSVQQK
jgi:hypothetical protein